MKKLTLLLIICLAFVSCYNDKVLILEGSKGKLENKQNIDLYIKDKSYKLVVCKNFFTENGKIILGEYELIKKSKKCSLFENNKHIANLDMIDCENFKKKKVSNAVVFSVFILFSLITVWEVISIIKTNRKEEWILLFSEKLSV